ncbi:MAG TPA: alpha-L-fucosidase [Candidatus Sumerlaeota bacterium]|nr:alpha-L-fucosidase [Candidatus Sumerlaeota bacterium]
MIQRVWKTVAAFFLLAAICFAAEPPAPYGPLPSERQLQWHETEFYAFIHFTTNTFTDKEWGYGDESESVFNPTAFDADQIVQTCRDAGMKGVVLTCKHHDGFCLWPSKYTEHSVKKSPWKDGKGDVVREISDACRKYGLKFGVYLSPWDRNHKDYGKPEYLEYFRNQLRELLTNYGPIFEVWFDGANGGDGYYGGAREKRSIDNSTYYDWPNTWAIVRELQPGAAMFSDVGPDTRWVGTEAGYAGDPCWATITDEGWYPGHAPSDQLLTGHRNGKKWLPAETNVSIRPGWFYHASEDKRVRSSERLFQHWFESIGRGTNFILNLPPDRRGILHENDVASLRGFRKLMDATFSHDLAPSATAIEGSTRGNDPEFSPQNLLDGKRDTYWTTDDSVTTPEVTLEFKQPVTFNIVRMREYLPLGQRVDDWALDTWQEGQWQEFAKGSAIGACRLVRGKSLTTKKVRLRITKAPVCPALSEFGLFAEPIRLDMPTIQRDRQGLLTLTSPSAASAEIHYTLDGSEPDSKSPLYKDPIPFPQGGVVKTRVVNPKDGQQGEVATAPFGLAKGKWKVVSTSFDASGSQGANVIDDNPTTLWQTHGLDGERQPPQDVVVDLGETVNVKAFTYLPRQDGIAHGLVDKYEFYLSADGKTWDKPAASGEFSNIRANPVLQTVTLSQPVQARYFKFVATHAVEKNHVAVAELGIVPVPSAAQ